MNDRSLPVPGHQHETPSCIDRATAPKPEARDGFLVCLGGLLATLDQTDGFRKVFNDDRIAHPRLSGTAPELRAYIDPETRARRRNSYLRLYDGRAEIGDWCDIIQFCDKRHRRRYRSVPNIALGIYQW